MRAKKLLMSAAALAVGAGALTGAVTTVSGGTPPPPEVDAFPETESIKWVVRYGSNRAITEPTKPPSKFTKYFEKIEDGEQVILDSGQPLRQAYVERAGVVPSPEDLEQPSLIEMDAFFKPGAALPPEIGDSDARPYFWGGRLRTGVVSSVDGPQGADNDTIEGPEVLAVKLGSDSSVEDRFFTGVEGLPLKGDLNRGAGPLIAKVEAKNEAGETVATVAKQFDHRIEHFNWPDIGGLAATFEFSVLGDGEVAPDVDGEEGATLTGNGSGRYGLKNNFWGVDFHLQAGEFLVEGGEPVSDEIPDVGTVETVCLDCPDGVIILQDLFVSDGDDPDGENKLTFTLVPIKPEGSEADFRIQTTFTDETDLGGEPAPVFEIAPNVNADDYERPPYCETDDSGELLPPEGSDYCLVSEGGDADSRNATSIFTGDPKGRFR